MSELAWQVIFGEMHAQGITLSLMLVAISATVRERSRGGQGTRKHQSRECSRNKWTASGSTGEPLSSPGHLPGLTGEMDVSDWFKITQHC